MVQSIPMQSGGSGVRIPQLPQKEKASSNRCFFCFQAFFVGSLSKANSPIPFAQVMLVNQQILSILVLFN